MRMCRSENATTIQRYWRGWRWRLWLDSATMPYVSSWHPQATFLNASRFECILDAENEDEAEAIRNELEGEVDTYRSLAKMAADHYGPERITYDALKEQIRENAFNCDDIEWQTEQLVKALLALNGIPYGAIDCAVGSEVNFVRAVATLKAPANKRRRLA